MVWDDLIFVQKMRMEILKGGVHLMHGMPPLHIWLHFERSTLRWSFNTQSSSDLGIKKWRMLSRFILTNTDYPLERTWGGSILITEKTSQTPSQELVKVFYALSETNNDQFMTKSKFQLRQKWSEVNILSDSVLKNWFKQKETFLFTSFLCSRLWNCNKKMNKLCHYRW